MATNDMLVTIGVVVAFTLFMGTLAYVSWWTHR